MMSNANSLARAILVFVGATLLTGCGEMIHQEYYPSRTTAVQLMSTMTCENPVELTIGCSRHKYANLPVNLRGIEMMLASTADGTNVLIRSPKNNDYTSITANLAFEAVRTELQKNGVGIVSVTAVTGSHFAGRELVLAYLVALDQDGFRFLSPFAVDKNK